MRFCPKRLIAVPSSNPDVKRYVYGLHSVILVNDIISFSSLGEGEMSPEVKLAICRHFGVEDPVFLSSSPNINKYDPVIIDSRGALVG